MPYILTDTAAQILGVSTETIRRRVRCGLYRAHKQGRNLAIDVRSIIEAVRAERTYDPDHQAAVIARLRRMA